MFKSKEVDIPLRRSELIAPTGVGAITTNSDGVNLMPGSLDVWFSNTAIKEDEFTIYEERLSKILGTNSFRLPPDHRIPFNHYQQRSEENLNIRIPMIRFPNWYYCSFCKVMSKEASTRKDSVLKCSHCENKYARLVQVPLVVICDKGHLDDFPWNQWVHESLSPDCDGPLKLISTGGATLSSMKVKCTKCPKERKLRGLTSRGSEHLYYKLSKEDNYRCSGRKPWFGDHMEKEICNSLPQPILKNASNAYFPQVLSAIYLPADAESHLQKVIDELSTDDKMNIINAAKGQTPIPVIASILKMTFSQIKSIEDSLLAKALNSIVNPEDKKGETNEEGHSVLMNLKAEEYRFLSSDQGLTRDSLIVHPEYNNTMDEKLYKKFGIKKINLIPKLQETRVLYGFSRLNPPAPLANNLESIVENGKANLFMNPSKFDWLPAYRVHGEGIYIEFDDELLSDWENSIKGSLRSSQLKKRLDRAAGDGVSVKENITPRYIMLHTLAHLFIQEIVLSCGYSSTALKERIYTGPVQDGNMNGFLIYTASGDSEGTMGGLVRLGKLQSIEDILEKTISKAGWCSSDPVCNEIGTDIGQGRDLLNGAACHNCAYISEISCEELNKYLDRGFVNIYEQDKNYQSFFSYISQKLNG